VSRRFIAAPSTFRPVADVVDPEHGPDEINPAPGLDCPGTRYLVGTEEELWEIDPEGWVVTAAGTRLGAREATKRMKTRGARLLYLARW